MNLVYYLPNICLIKKTKKKQTNKLEALERERSAVSQTVFDDRERLAQPTPVLKVIERMGIKSPSQLKFVDLLRPFSFVRPSRPTRTINAV